MWDWGLRQGWEWALVHLLLWVLLRAIEIALALLPGSSAMTCTQWKSADLSCYRALAQGLYLLQLFQSSFVRYFNYKQRFQVCLISLIRRRFKLKSHLL